MYRVGIGHDTHRLAEGLPLVLGGVRVESERGAEGHSDADALAHAVTDAVLGAMCEGDIGQHFPDNDPRWQGADSLQLLARVMWLASERGYRVVNADATVHIERPPCAGQLEVKDGPVDLGGPLRSTHPLLTRVPVKRLPAP